MTGDSMRSSTSEDEMAADTRRSRWAVLQYHSTRPRTKECRFECAVCSIAKSSATAPMRRLPDLPGQCSLGGHLFQEKFAGPDYSTRRAPPQGPSLGWSLRARQSPSFACNLQRDRPDAGTQVRQMIQKVRIALDFKTPPLTETSISSGWVFSRCGRPPRCRSCPSSVPISILSAAWRR